MSDRTLAAEVIRHTVCSRFHHLFVIDSMGKILRVISTCDVLRHLL
jgi:hypothetical protein